MSKPVCRSCGSKVVHGNLFCSAGCGHGATAEWTAAINALESHGFERDGLANNIFRKDGVAVTLEGVIHAGLAQTIDRHTHAAAIGAGDRIPRTISGAH